MVCIVARIFRSLCPLWLGLPVEVCPPAETRDQIRYLHEAGEESILARSASARIEAMRVLLPGWS
jgi:hypothetical protein